MYSVRCSGASALNTGRASSPGFIAVKTAIQACCAARQGSRPPRSSPGDRLPPSTSKMEPPISIHPARPAGVLLRARSRPYRRQCAHRSGRAPITDREAIRRPWDSLPNMSGMATVPTVLGAQIIGCAVRIPVSLSTFGTGFRVRWGTGSYTCRDGTTRPDGEIRPGCFCSKDGRWRRCCRGGSPDDPAAL